MAVGTQAHWLQRWVEAYQQGNLTSLALVSSTGLPRTLRDLMLLLHCGCHWFCSGRKVTGPCKWGRIVHMEWEITIQQ